MKAGLIESTLFIRIHEPYSTGSAGGEFRWNCTVVFRTMYLGERDSERRSLRATGVDSMDALLSALDLIQIELTQMERDGLTLYWLDKNKPDAGFELIKRHDPAKNFALED
jgi:hypothetical protein